MKRPPERKRVEHVTDDLTPRKIVEKLDLYIIGQQEAKRAVAIALRNRWRRQNVSKELGEEISPKNIIMIGPTGVGKTEIARRLAKLETPPSSRSRPPSSRRWATSAGMWNPWSGIFWNWPSTWSRRKNRTASGPRLRNWPRTASWISCSLRNRWKRR
jgi:hypothetical protein